VLPIAESRFTEHVELVERYLSLLERVVALYLTEPTVRDYFDLGPVAHALVTVQHGFTRNVHICRLDGYLQHETGALSILENNADCPAGTLFTQRLNALVEGISRDVLGADTALLRTPLDGRRAALDALLAAHREWGGTAENPVIAILQLAGKANLESLEMAREFSALGVETVVADPRELDLSHGPARVQDRRVHCVWNKINTVYWNALVLESPELPALFARAIAERRLCHVNPFSARYVLENKRCLALLQEPETEALFTAQERALVSRLLPWSRKLAPGKRVVFEGREHDIEQLLSEQPHRFVLKEPYDIRGDGVTIGCAADRSTWSKKLHEGLNAGFVAQEYVRPTQFPIVAPNGHVCPMTVSLDTFVFGGRVVGLGSKASTSAKVNLFQGGRKLSARVVATPRET
ncbi:MAG TPA: hypothetical protein VM686_15390, partial [Polyangiaceae bacterium]|nr:hypothetical protein [Polyangiaceae bacterium]